MTKKVKINLICMPFHEVTYPSIGITHIQSILKERACDIVNVETHYINHDFYNFLGSELYNFITNNFESYQSGLGEWFFRHIVYPEKQDNYPLYHQRYLKQFAKGKEEFLNYFVYKRNQLDLFLEEIIAKYNLLDSDIVGFTSLFYQHFASLALAKKIKDKNRDITIIMGGVNCFHPMGDATIKYFDQIDYIFSGDGSNSILDFVKYYSKGQMVEIDNINGVLSKNRMQHEESGGVKNQNEMFGDPLNINKFPKLDYTSFFKSLKELKLPNHKPELFLLTSLGCYWGECKFCAFHTLKSGYKSLENNIAQKYIQSHIDQYCGDVKKIFFTDNAIPRKYILEVFPKLNIPDDVTIHCLSRADVSEKELKILSMSNVVSIQVGIEALSTTSLNLMAKGATAIKNIVFLKNCVKYNIEAIWSFLIGFPGENEKIYEFYFKNLPYFYHLNPPGSIIPLRYDRFGSYYKDSKKYKLKLFPLDYYKYLYDLDQEEIEKFAFYYYDSNVTEYNYLAASLIEQLSGIMNEWKQKWNNKQNRPVLELVVNSDESYLIDTRYELKEKITLSDLSKSILMNLNFGMKEEGLIETLKEFDQNRIENEIIYLKNKKIIFEDDVTKELISLAIYY